MKKFAVIVAAGSGLRMGSETPKQFLLLNGKPILWHSINSFLNTFNDINIIIVLSKEYIETGEQIRKDFLIDGKRITVAMGGETRFHSVQNGLKSVEENSIVFVHDAVRCLITETLIKRCYEQTILLGSAIPAVSAIDSIRIVEGDSHRVIKRASVKRIQTPQTFHSNTLIAAYNQNYQEYFTDEATVVEYFGKQVYLCEGDYNNIKITTPIDLKVAEELLVK